MTPYKNWFISLSHPERQETKKTKLNIYIILWNFMIFHEVAKLIDNTVHTKDMSKSMRLVVWSDLVIGVSIPLVIISGLLIEWKQIYSEYRLHDIFFKIPVKTHNDGTVYKLLWNYQWKHFFLFSDLFTILSLFSGTISIVLMISLIHILIQVKTKTF